MKSSTTSSICKTHYSHVAQKRCQPYPYISFDSNVELRADIQVTLPSHRARLATLEERQRFQSFTTNAVNMCKSRESYNPDVFFYKIIFHVNLCFTVEEQ